MSIAPDMLFHMGGVPVGGPLIPTSAKVYFVDAKNGSDGSQGRRADNALATIAAAITKVNANISWSASPWAQRDVIYIMPGTYAENITSMPYGAVMIGAGYDVRDAQTGVKIKPASGDAVDCSSVINTEIYNMGFESVDTAAAFDADSVNNCLFDNCFFTGPAELTTSVYGFITSDLTKTTFRNCWAANADNGFYFNYTDGGDKVAYLLMEGCVITGCSATGIYTHINLVGPHSQVRHCTITGAGQTTTIGIDDNAGVLDEMFNAIEATTAVSGVRSSNGSYGNGTLLT